MTFDLIIVGFGRVARRFVSLLDEQRVVSARVVETVTRRPDSVAHVRRLVKKHATAARAGRLVVVEATTLDVKTGEPAIGHLRAALRGGAHVITVNKGPVAFAYADLARAAVKAGRQFLFEGAVMDGVPVFNFARQVLPGITISGFRGVVNSTTNYIITAVEQGDSFGASLAAMQRAGIAEADASLDIDGWDAAAKTAALANVLLDARITPHDVQRESLTDASTTAIRDAKATGRRMKVVASARGRGPTVHARVGLVELSEGDLLAGLDGPQNAIMFDTDLLGEVAIVELGSGLTQTAYGLLTDLVTISQAPRARPGRTPSPRGHRRR